MTEKISPKCHFYKPHKIFTYSFKFPRNFTSLYWSSSFSSSVISKEITRLSSYHQLPGVFRSGRQGGEGAGQTRSPWEVYPGGRQGWVVLP